MMIMLILDQCVSVQLNVCRIGQQSTFVLPCPNDDMGRVMTCGDHRYITSAKGLGGWGQK
jgi:hypothetical protein